MKQTCLCLARVRQTDEPYGGQQVRPDQTKTVKGQSGKTLATAGTIKGPLPCPELNMEKQSVFYEVKRKQSKRKQEKEKEKR